MDRNILRLYAVTDRQYLKEGQTLADAVERALIGGVTCVQLREKDLPRTALREEALTLKALCASYGVPLILDDDVLLAAELDLAGVHIGQDDMSASDAREILGPGKILGVTAKTPAQARAAALAGADYLGSGAMFATTTKPEARPMTPDALREITGSTALPVVAIGGIDRTNAHLLAGTGIAGLAVAGGLFKEEDIAAAARQLRSIELS